MGGIRVLTVIAPFHRSRQVHAGIGPHAPTVIPIPIREHDSVVLSA
jgi:hypothetical protein